MMSKSKSPFIVIDEFISPLMCEDIVERSHMEFPNTEGGVPVKSITQNVLTQNRILPYLEDLIPHLEAYFGFQHGGILPFNIETYPQGCKQEVARSENSELGVDNEWKRVNDRDFTGIIFLKDNCDESRFDDYFEVYGTKLEFPNHGFGFRPARGQLVLFPSAPNFINATVSPKLGDMVQIRFHLVASDPYTYDRNDFPGNYTTWF